MERHFDDSGSTTLTADFCYAEVDARLGHCDPLINEKEQERFEAWCQYNSLMWGWITQGDIKNVDGFVCRSAIMAKVWDPALRELTYTELAGRVGKDKQSLGRWVEMLKLRFPEITKHLPHLKDDN